MHEGKTIACAIDGTKADCIGTAQIDIQAKTFLCHNPWKFLWTKTCSKLNEYDNASDLFYCRAHIFSKIAPIFTW